MGTRVLLDGLAFAEGPRWRNGRLYFSDVAAGQVIALDPGGGAETVVEVDGGPSGLGWLPDGRLLIARGTPPAVLRLEPDGSLAVHADLSELASFPCNDMVVDAGGVAWVGACDLEGIPQPKPSELIVVRPDGSAEVADADMRFPNGSVVTPDGSTLIVAETFGGALTAFSIGEGGRLSGKREWAPLPGALPDGICLDAEGAVWFADPIARAAVRVAEGGEILDRVATEDGCFACTLGGDDGRTLFLLTGSFGPPAQNREARPGRIQATEVAVAGSGSP